MKVYKGTDKDMRCKGLQDEIGKAVTVGGDVKLCERGLHACEMPLDVLNYYHPATSRYFEAELEGLTAEKQDDTKRVGNKLALKAELSIADLVKAQIEYVKERATPKNTENATGNLGAASATGNLGAASATGYLGAASATGYLGAASATGNLGAASATGYRGAASATGKACVALSAGIDGKVMGEIGNAIVCVERGDRNGETYPIKAILSAVVDGETIKAGVWYTVKNGKWVEEE